MNVFRLVLCLAGLTIYLVVKQIFNSSFTPSIHRPADPPAEPSAEVQERVSRLPCPQSTPQLETLASNSTFVKVGR
jgi:hypothetical protein